MFKSLYRVRADRRDAKVARIGKAQHTNSVTMLMPLKEFLRIPSRLRDVSEDGDYTAVEVIV